MFITSREMSTASPEVAEGSDGSLGVPPSMATHRVGKAGLNADGVLLAAQGAMTAAMHASWDRGALRALFRDARCCEASRSSVDSAHVSDGLVELGLGQPFREEVGGIVLVLDVHDLDLAAVDALHEPV